MGKINWNQLQTGVVGNLKNFSQSEWDNRPFASLEQLTKGMSKQGGGLVEAAQAQPGYDQRGLCFDALLGDGRPQKQEQPQIELPRLDRKKFNSNLGDIPSKFNRKWVAK